MAEKQHPGSAVALSIAFIISTAGLVHVGAYAVAVIAAWLSLASACDYIVRSIQERER